MESRRSIRKRKNNRNSIILVLIGLVLALGLIFGVVAHNRKVRNEAVARKFAVTHFNPNVTIYGVKVGNLTVAKATAKINQKAKNTAELVNNKIVLSRNNKQPTISKAEVQKYFKLQHTTSPNNKAYNYQSEALSTAKAKLNALSKASLKFTVAGNSYDLKASELVTHAGYQNGKIQYYDVKKLTAKLNQIDKENTTLKKSYKFTVPSGKSVNGKTITVKNESYGWGVYVKKTREAVEAAFANGTKELKGENYLYGLGYSTYPHGYGEKNHGIGENYIVVSLKKQELWIVRKGVVAVHLTDVVTGTMTGDKTDRTPTGVWYIHYKESPSVLRGYNDDGSKYASKVQYWMPFTLSGCGLHDASWRTDWSKTAYLKGGSHGCVNIKPSEIKSVWNNVIKNEPVIVY